MAENFIEKDIILVACGYDLAPNGSTNLKLELNSIKIYLVLNIKLQWLK